MRKGLFRKIQGAGAADLARVQENIGEAVDSLVTAHDILSSPVVRMIATGALAAGAAVAVFGGGASCRLTLPTAANQGPNVASVLMFINSSAVSVTLVPSPSETLNGGMAIAVLAGTLVTLVSDGAKGWYAG